MEDPTTYRLDQEPSNCVASLPRTRIPLAILIVTGADGILVRWSLSSYIDGTSLRSRRAAVGGTPAEMDQISPVICTMMASLGLKSRSQSYEQAVGEDSFMSIAPPAGDSPWQLN